MERNVLITRVHLADRPFGQTVCIALKGSRIISVGEAPEGFAADEVVDGRGMLATAGMVNAHCHASMTLLRSHADDMALMDWLQNHIWPAESRLTDDAVYWGAMLGIAEMLKGGVTCFADCTSAWTAWPRRPRRWASEPTSPRAFSAQASEARRPSPRPPAPGRSGRALTAAACA